MSALSQHECVRGSAGLTNAHNKCDAWLLDGQQRVTAILEYTAGVFSVGGVLFTDADESDQRAFLMRPIAAQESRIEDEATCRQVYEALALGGTPHAPDQYATDAIDTGPRV